MKEVVKTFIKEVWDAMDPVGAMWRDRVERLQVQRDEAREEVELLTDLIRHMQIHAGYTKCGYGRMTAAQKELFNRLNGTE